MLIDTDVLIWKLRGNTKAAEQRRSAQRTLQTVDASNGYSSTKTTTTTKEGRSLPRWTSAAPSTGAGARIGGLRYRSSTLLYWLRTVAAGARMAWCLCRDSPVMLSALPVRGTARGAATAG
jgi:hypothetical protein